jgi:hypothetical protein
VPTLILSGGQDLRTPTAEARTVAAMIPGARLEVVPYTGHSVLGSDLSGCAATAVQRFFAGQRETSCGLGMNVFSPTPVTPTRLASITATPGLGGRPGRTVTAVLDSILDLDRLIVAATLQAEQELPSGSRFGGLRGGYAAITSSSVRLVHFSFVRGVALSGTWPISHGKLLIRPLRVEGNEAAHGTVLLHSDHRVSGTLAGTSFEVAVSGAVLARAGARSAADRALASVWAGTWPLAPSGLPGSLVSSRSALGHIR